MSFLDERDDPPRRSAGRYGSVAVDRQTLVVRRTVALGGIVLILILLVLGVRGCLNARKERAFKDYVRDAAALVEESTQQSEQLFGVLREPGGQTAVDLENNVNGFRVQADQLVDRAKDTDHPDQVDRAHRFLIETLELRRDGIGGIARELPTALSGRERANASDRIAAQMQNFLASDVIYTQRFVPRLLGGLKDEDLLDDVPIPETVKAPARGFLPDIDWLRPAIVRDRVSRVSGGPAPATPGLHGNGLGAVTVKPSGKALVEGGAVDIAVSEDLAFDVQIQNQGESAEQDVTVRVSITGAGRPIELEEQLDTIAPRETKTVTIPLADTPPTGRAVTIKLEIKPVPGERKTDNNRGSFTAVFTG